MRHSSLLIALHTPCRCSTFFSYVSCIVQGQILYSPYFRCVHNVPVKKIPKFSSILANTVLSYFLNTKLRRTPLYCGSLTWRPYPVIYQRTLSGHNLPKQNTGAPCNPYTRPLRLLSIVDNNYGIINNDSLCYHTNWHI